MKELDELNRALSEFKIEVFKFLKIPEIVEWLLKQIKLWKS